MGIVQQLKERIRNSRYRHSLPRILRYGFAFFVTTALILVASLGLPFSFSRAWPPVLLCSVILSSWYGGMGPGLLSALVVVTGSELFAGSGRILGTRDDLTLLILLIMLVIVLSQLRVQLSQRKRSFGVLSPDDVTKLLSHMDRVLELQQPAHFEEYLDSRRAWYAFHCYPTDNGLVLKYGDITAARRQQALLPLPVWEDDREFIGIFNRIEFTLVDKARCYILHQLAKQAAQLPGDLGEVGVYRGGTAKLLALTTAPRAQKALHLFDTFTGMPPTDAAADHHHEGDLGGTSLEAVQRSLRDCSNIHFYKGLFPETAGPIENNRFCLVHIDADIYKSVKDSCAFFYPRMEKGGIMVFDDYGFPSCPGARKAVDEFFSDKPEAPVYLPSGQCVVFRR